MNDDDDTRAASVSDETAAAPGDHATELIETPAAPTPELAWSDAADEHEADAISENRSRATWLGPVVALSVAAIAVLSILLFYVHRTAAPNAPAPVPSSDNARPVPLDGTYRLDYDAAKQTQNGAPEPQPNTTGWWAFRSSCRSTECVATGTALDGANHQLARTPALTSDFFYRDGHWQATRTTQVPRPRCLAANQEVIAGTATELIAFAFEPQAGGTLRGVHTETVLTNECGSQGTVLQTPFVMTRTGDAPPGVAATDPATVIAPPTTNTTDVVVGGPVLDGTFRVDGATNETEWWAFRSLCTSKGCSATGSELADTNHGQGTGVAKVLHFVDGHWQDTPYLQAPSQCPGTEGTARDNETHGWSLNPQPDGTLAGAQTDTVATNECGRQGTISQIPIVVTRMGDVPPTVVLADPGLF